MALILELEARLSPARCFARDELSLERLKHVFSSTQMTRAPFGGLK